MDARENRRAFSVKNLRETIAKHIGRAQIQNSRPEKCLAGNSRAEHYRAPQGFIPMREFSQGDVIAMVFELVILKLKKMSR